MKEIEVKKRLPIILMNFNEVKSSLEDTMDKYRGIIVTEENLKKCKTTQKDLAKLRRGIDEYRKNVKKEIEKQTAMNIIKIDLVAKGIHMNEE